MHDETNSINKNYTTQMMKNETNSVYILLTGLLLWPDEVFSLFISGLTK